MTNEQAGGAAADAVRRRRVHEGPRNHLISYAISLVLTALAFLAVIYQDALEGWFIVGFLMLLAVIQALVQALYWMHMKDKGHMQPRIFMMAGVVVTFTCVVMALLWCWW